MFTGITVQIITMMKYARQNGMIIFMLYKLFTGTTLNILKSVGTTNDHWSIELYQRMSILMA